MYIIFLCCSCIFRFIRDNKYLTTNQKRIKAYKIYDELCGYIYDSYGQEYLELFEEKMYERGWINKYVDKENKGYRNKHVED